MATEVAIDRQLGPKSPRIPRTGATIHHYQRKKTGLEWLSDKGKLTPEQVDAGERYGRDYRFAALDSPAALKSSLAGLESAGGGGVKGGGLHTTINYTDLWLQAKDAVAWAQAALNYHTGMVLAVDLVCGQQQTPKEIASAQRDAEQIETGLRIALDILVVHYRTRDEARARERSN